MSRVELADGVVEGTVTVDGVEVRYFDSVADHSATGESSRGPIVLVHGTGGSTEAHYGYLFPLLAGRQRVVALDFARPVRTRAPLTLEQLEQQVVAVIEAVLPDRPVTLVGYSLGAVVAAAVAARHPGSVRNLVLVAGWMKTDAQQELRNQVWQRLREERSEALGEYMAFCAFSRPFLVAAQALGEFTPVLTAFHPDGFTDLQMELNRTIDISDLVPSIAATTLVIGCTHDQMVPKWHSKALFGSIPDARYTEIESGHAVVMERPAQLVQVISQFIEAPSRHAAGDVIATARP
ncbi:alpha/beta fold hydrolase [Streptomyces gibsoniae]|uniref:Alpha/beta hydrolase n=1 Tax=Streptomyces gibsoniae TaxID=3075529 RepID=A0ABU2TPY2_9ACTN|nr:alpha/beta hydrolase [Streptomyces sp. DSM 41699]MDT0463009.1 alpha/beta hydrolase [Streptomyces sp. DSM 41699]